MLLILIPITILFLFSLGSMGLLNFAQWGAAGGRLVLFFKDVFPPQVDILVPMWWAVLETLEIAFVGTILGFILAIPFAYFGNNILWGRRITYAVRFCIGIIRTIPSVLFGIIFVIAFGLGKAAGALAVAFYSAGYLSKLLYEAFEAVNPDVIEAVRSTGCSRVQLFRFAIVPESFTYIISQLLFMFEYNIRSSTIMGFVGAGGIGYFMMGYIQMLEYKHLCTAFLVTLFVVMIIDWISSRLRKLISRN